jgi:hypothetical protein
MRNALPLMLLFAAGIAHGQDVPQPDAGGQQIVVLVREHAMGPEILQISAVKPDYPSDLLEKQINSLAQNLGSQIRGLTIYYEELVPGDANMRFLKSSFSVDGLIEDGDLKLTPLLKAFAGAPEPYTVHGLRIIVEGVPPKPDRVKYFDPKTLSVEAKFDKDPPTTEYEVQLKTQNPGEITVSNKAPAAESTNRGETAPSGPNPVLVWTLVVVAGLAAGALVYSVVIRRQATRSG